MNKLTGLVVAAVVIAGAVGCGGDDKKPLSKGADDKKPLSKGAYVKQGNAICKRGDKKIDAGASEFKGKPTPKQFKTFVTKRFVPSVEDQVKQLRELEPPKGDKAKVEKIYKLADAGVAKVKADPSSIAKKPDPFGKAEQSLRAYGLTVCGS